MNAITNHLTCVKNGKKTLLASLTTLVYFGVHATAALAQDLNVPAVPSDFQSVTVDGRAISTPSQYQTLADYSNDALEVEVRVIQSGLIRDIADKSILTLLGQPSHQLDYIAATGSEKSEYRVIPPNTKELSVGMSRTPDQLVSYYETNKVVNGGTYRIFQVGLVVNGAKFWHEAMELCGSVCFIVDPVIPSLDEAIDNINEQKRLSSIQSVPNSKKLSFANADGSFAKATVCELTQFSPTDTDTDRKRTSFPEAARTKSIRKFRWWTTIPITYANMNIGYTEVTFRCDASCNIVPGVRADASSGTGSNGYKVSCDWQSKAGLAYDSSNSVKAWARSECVYFSEGNFTLDLNVTGEYQNMNGSSNFNAAADLGTKGQLENGGNYINTCAYFNR